MFQFFSNRIGVFTELYFKISKREKLICKLVAESRQGFILHHNVLETQTDEKILVVIVKEAHTLLQ